MRPMPTIFVRMALSADAPDSELVIIRQSVASVLAGSDAEAVRGIEMLDGMPPIGGIAPKARAIRPNCALNESAHHEAGHVVVAHALNLRVNYAYVAWDEERKRWGGGMKATPRLDDSDLATQDRVIAASKAKELLAGMLAQAKLMATQQVGSSLLTFSPNMVDCGDLWTLLKGSKRSEDAPGTIHLDFVAADGTIQPMRFQANACLLSDADITNFNDYVSGHWGSYPAESTEELVVETMQLLDDEACWKRVRTIAMCCSLTRRSWLSASSRKMN